MTSQNVITPRWGDYLRTVAIVAACTLVAGLMFPLFAPANLIMVYLVGNVVVATRYGRRASALAAFLSVLSFDFFYVPPYLTFAVSDTQYLLTFAVMLLVSLTISSMTTRIKEQAEEARERERATFNSYQMSRAFANSGSVDEIIQIAARYIQDAFSGSVVILLDDKNGDLHPHGTDQALALLTLPERGVARWAFDRRQQAGFGTETLPGSQGLYLPMLTSNGLIGVLALYPANHDILIPSNQQHLLETYANQTALAVERAHLSEETEQTRVEIEAERMRSTLLSSVSHDLRTPLAAITGAVSSILRDKALETESRELAQIAYEEAERLNRLLGNLLEMTRLESGVVHVEKEWQPLEEVVGTALMHLSEQIADRAIQINIPDDLALVFIDGIMIEQVLVNLIENAAKYTPPGSPIDLSAWQEGGEIVVEVTDRGQGIPPGEETRIFDKFYRVRPATSGGVGLGLAICRAIVNAHGGRIWAFNRSKGGASLRFTLPLDGEPPKISVEDEQAR